MVQEITKEDKDKALVYLADNLTKLYNSAKLIPKSVGYEILLSVIKENAEDKEAEIIKGIIQAIIIILKGNDDKELDAETVAEFDKKIDGFGIMLPLLSNVLNGNLTMSYKDNDFAFKITPKGEQDIFGILKKLHEGEE